MGNMASRYATDWPTIRDQVSPEEWQARLDLAACYRLVDAYGMTDLIYNHITLRIPGEAPSLINLYGLLYREITATSLAKIDSEGNIICKPDPPNTASTSRLRHPLRDPQGAAGRGRGDPHPHPAGMAVASMRCGLLPLTQTTMRFVGISATTTMKAPCRPRGTRVDRRDLGRHDALIMRNHGLLDLRQHAAAGLQHALPAGDGLPRPGGRDGRPHRADDALGRDPGEDRALYQPGTRRPYGVLD